MPGVDPELCGQMVSYRLEQKAGSDVANAARLGLRMEPCCSRSRRSLDHRERDCEMPYADVVERHRRWRCVGSCRPSEGRHFRTCGVTLIAGALTSDSFEIVGNQIEVKAAATPGHTPGMVLDTRTGNGKSLGAACTSRR